MTLRLSIWFTAILCLTGCGAFAAEVSRDMAPLISTEVAVQVGTAVAEFPAAAPQPLTATAEVAQTQFDCVPKYCKDMTSCEEAVYQCGTYAKLEDLTTTTMVFLASRFAQRPKFSASQAAQSAQANQNR